MAWDDLAPRVISSLSRDLNLTPDQAAGIVGQLGYESNGLQAVNEQNPTVPGSRGGFGWAQWTGPRRQAFETWAANNGMSVSDPNANYGFLINELKNGPESSVVPEIRNAKTAQDAGRIFTDRFLRPGVPNHAERQSWTQKALDFLIPPAQADTVASRGEGPWARFAPSSPAPEGPWARFQSSEPAASAPQAPKAPAHSESDGYLPQIRSGVLEGITGILGAPVDLTNAVIGLGLRGVNSLFGTHLQPSDEPLGGSKGLRIGLPIAPPSESTGPQIARRVAQSLGASLPVFGQVRNLQQGAAALGTALSGGFGGAAAQQVFPGSPTAEAIGEALGGLGGAGSISGIINRTARRTAAGTIPSVGDLRSQAADLYDMAERQGITATRPQTQGLAQDMHTIAQQEGLISPTGRVSEAYPKAREALRMLDDYGQGTMSVPQMQTVRKVLSDAAGSPDAAERRIASIMLARFDDFTSPLAPQLKDARMLYARALRGERLETLQDLAASRAGQFTGSGYENALRTEYRQLNNRIIKGKERGWTPDQQEAIRRVAEGTTYGNALRNMGRMAPTGPVSFSASAGLPFALGTALTGNPWVGSAMGGLVSGLGYGARNMATQQSIRNAQIAELLARGDRTAPLAIKPELWPQMLGAALADQAVVPSN